MARGLGLTRMVARALSQEKGAGAAAPFTFPTEGSSADQRDEMWMREILCGLNLCELTRATVWRAVDTGCGFRICTTT